MPRMTKEQVEAHLARMERVGVGSNAPQFADKGPESHLQAKIVKWAAERGYPCLSIQPRRPIKGEVTPGWPDITLAMENRILLIELKSARGALRDRQATIAKELRFLGHSWHQIRAYKQFLEVVNEGNSVNPGKVGQ